MREKKFEKIEKNLSIILQILSTEEYLDFIYSNDSLNQYDKIMSKVDNGDYPSNYKDKITEDMLDEIIVLLDKKTNSYN